MTFLQHTFSLNYTTKFKTFTIQLGFYVFLVFSLNVGRELKIQMVFHLVCVYTYLFIYIGDIKFFFFILILIILLLIFKL